MGKVCTRYSDSSTLVLGLWYYRKIQQVLGTQTLRLTLKISWTQYFLSTFIIFRIGRLKPQKYEKNPKICFIGSVLFIYRYFMTKNDFCSEFWFIFNSLMIQTCFKIRDFSGTFSEYQVLSTRTFVLSEITCWTWYSVLFQNSLKTMDSGLGTRLYFLREVLTLPISACDGQKIFQKYLRRPNLIFLT